MRWFSSPLRDCAFPRDISVSRSRVFIYLGLAVTLLLLSYQLILDQAPIIGTNWTTGQGISVAGDNDHVVSDPTQPAEKELVLAAMQASNMSWVEEYLSDWKVNIYRADAKDGDVGLTVPVNKGNEAMVYLTCVFDLLIPSIPSIFSYRLSSSPLAILLIATGLFLKYRSSYTAAGTNGMSITRYMIRSSLSPISTSTSSRRLVM